MTSITIFIVIFTKMNLKELRLLFAANLAPIYQESEAEAIFYIALKAVLNYNRAAFILQKVEDLTNTNLIKFEAILNELKQQKPIQYILGETIFYGLPFKVNPNALIPRPETEELLAWVLETIVTNKFNANNPAQPLTILDIGTGSGCIPIALKKHLPAATVFGLDISAKALKTAKENATLNQVTVQFIKANILDIKTLTPNITYNIIISNPPYITQQEKPTMQKNVLAYEPHLALFVSNQNPLIFYQAIANFALNNLAANGLLFFEINEKYATEVMQLLAAKNFKNISLKKDMQGKDRMICAEK